MPKCFIHINCMLLLFCNRDTTVVCAYSIEDIDQVFARSKLKGYNSPLTGTRHGMVHNVHFHIIKFSQVYIYTHVFELASQFYPSQADTSLKDSLFMPIIFYTFSFEPHQKFCISSTSVVLRIIQQLSTQKCWE